MHAQFVSATFTVRLGVIFSTVAILLFSDAYIIQRETAPFPFLPNFLLK